MTICISYIVGFIPKRTKTAHNEFGENGARASSAPGVFPAQMQTLPRIFSLIILRLHCYGLRHLWRVVCLFFQAAKASHTALIPNIFTCKIAMANYYTLACALCSVHVLRHTKPLRPFASTKEWIKHLKSERQRMMINGLFGANSQHPAQPYAMHRRALANQRNIRFCSRPLLLYVCALRNNGARCLETIGDFNVKIVMKGFQIPSSSLWPFFHEKFDWKS